MNQASILPVLGSWSLLSLLSLLTTHPFPQQILNDDGSIFTSRAWLYHLGAQGADMKIEAMDSAVETCRKSDFGLEHVVPNSEL